MVLADGDAMRFTARVITLAAAIAAAAGLVGSAASARAASGEIVVASAGSPASHVGELSIGLDATSTINASALTAVLYPAGSTTAALTVTGFTQTSGPATGPGATVWTVTAPIPYGSGPGELPLGTYSIEVKASDQGGDSTDTTDAGTLAYLILPVVTLSVSPAAYSLGQNVTLSGTDIGLYPDGSHQPLGQQIDIDGTQTTTDPAGSFSETVRAGSDPAGLLLSGSRLSAQVAGSMTTAAATSNVVPVTNVKDPVRVTHTQTPGVVSAGGTVTIFGNASYQTGSGWLPLTNVGVGILGSRGVGWGATTDSSGNYSVSGVAVDVPSRYGLVLSGLKDAAWMSVGSMAVVIVPAGVRVADSITARMTTTGHVAIRACITINGGPVWWPAAAPLPAVHVQYAAAAAGPWRTLVSGAARFNGGFGWRCLLATPRKPSRAVFYRTVSSADTAYTAGGSRKTQAVPVAKTRIPNFGVSPSKVRAGHQVKVAGHLLGGIDTSKVEILFRPAGSDHWQIVRRLSLHTDSDTTPYTAFSAWIKMNRSGSFEARFAGGEFFRPCRSRIVFVRVTH
jgi:hypothetical protein